MVRLLFSGDEGGTGIVYRWYGLAEVPSDWDGSVVTIGVFDGVHRGHQRDVRRAAEIAQARNLPVVVVTFDPHPDEVVRPGSHPAVLTTERRQAELLADLGADAVCVLPFTLEFSRMSPDEFVRGGVFAQIACSAGLQGAKGVVFFCVEAQDQNG